MRCWKKKAAGQSHRRHEFIADGTNLGDVGGLEGLKTWLVERSKLFEMRDSLDAEIVPKGLLMMGIPGCGKSLCVKAIASQFNCRCTAWI